MWWFSKVPYHLPKSRGPFTPGCMDVALDYGKSGIFFRLYYPTDIKDADEVNYKKWLPFFPDQNYVSGASKVIMVSTKIINFFYWKGGSMKVPILYGEKAKTDRKLKCIIFSHGLGAYRSLYSTICGEMASRGYLVAAIEHRDESSCYTYFYKSKEDALNDRRTPIPFKTIKFGKGHLESRAKQNHYRSDECSKLIDFLIDLNKGIIPYNVISDVPSGYEIGFKLEDLIGNLDTDSLTISGHSFGGATALLTISKRPELKQGVIFDPWMFPLKTEQIEDKIDVPLLFVNSQTFHIKANVIAMEKYMGKDRDTEMYTMAGTTHENHGDALFWSGYWLNWFMKKINPIAALHINNSLVLRFLKKTTSHDCNIEDCLETLKLHDDKILSGLTKPWA